MTVEPGAEPETSLETGPGLAWRIPSSEEWLALRMARVRWFLTLVVFSLIIVFAWPGETRFLAFAISVPLLAALWWWLVRRTQASLPSEPNVWLDSSALRWKDNRGQLQRLPREQIAAFMVGEHGEQGPVWLKFETGFRSQPIVVHRPATATLVREYLRDRWHIAEQPHDEDAETNGVCLAKLPVYSEMHDEDRVWHLEGEAPALRELADVLTRAAEASLPPTGAAPLAQHALLERRDASLLHLLVDQATILGADSLSAPPERLRELANRFRSELSARGSEPEWSFDWPTGDGVWTIVLHLP
jgi:hypothetical protein